MPTYLEPEPYNAFDSTNQSNLADIDTEITSLDEALAYIQNNNLSDAQLKALREDIWELYTYTHADNKANLQTYYGLGTDNNLGWGHKQAFLLNAGDTSEDPEVVVIDYLFKAISQELGFNSVRDMVLADTADDGLGLDISDSDDLEILSTTSIFSLTEIAQYAFSSYNDKKKEELNLLLAELDAINLLLELANLLRDEQNDIKNNGHPNGGGSKNRIAAQVEWNDTIVDLYGLLGWEIDGDDFETPDTSGVYSLSIDDLVDGLDIIGDSGYDLSDLVAKIAAHFPGSDHLDFDRDRFEEPGDSYDGSGDPSWRFTSGDERDAFLEKLDTYIDYLQAEADTITLELNNAYSRSSESYEWFSTYVSKILEELKNCARSVV